MRQVTRYYTSQTIDINVYNMLNHIRDTLVSRCPLVSKIQFGKHGFEEEKKNS